MIRIISKILFTVMLVFGFSVMAMAQSGNDKDKKRPPKSEKKDPPKIVIPKKNDRPKQDQKKPKPPAMEFGSVAFYIRENGTN